MNWVFQYDPHRIQMTVEPGATGWWAAAQHRDQIGPNDRIYFFKSGPGAGIAATGQTTGPVRTQQSEFGKYAVDILITSMVTPTVSRAELATLPAVASMPVFSPAGQQGINFILDTTQAAALDAFLLSRPADAQNGTTWDLRAGDSIKRTELHNRFGGSGQGGISPSRSSANVFLFTDPTVGEQHGYIRDGPTADGFFEYTGEGQQGDQVLKAGNHAIRAHRNEGRRLRLFKGSRGTVIYVGEYELAEPDPFRYAVAPSSGGGALRRVIVFRLRAIAAPPKTVSPDHETEARVSNVPIEQVFSDSIFIRMPQEPVEAQRREAKLVKRFCSFMEANGHSVHRKMIIPSGSSSPMYTDVHVEDLNLLVEAKRTIERSSFRMAIGQLADYSRFLGQPRCAILLPISPSKDLIQLALSQRILLCWPKAGGFTFIDPDASSVNTDVKT